MAITYCTEEVKIPSIPRRRVNRWIKEVAGKHGCKVGDVSYIFCSDEQILRINNEYLQHNYYTDIITFDYTEERKISGDIFVSLDTVRSNAEKYGVVFENELYRVIIHGILHLCGINDKTPGEREVMEAEENEALSLLSDFA